MHNQSLPFTFYNYPTMIFDYPQMIRDEYVIPSWIEPEIMYNLSSSRDVRDKKIHDYIILSNLYVYDEKGKKHRKYSSDQIRRMLYLSKYSYHRLVIRMQGKLTDSKVAKLD